MDRPSSVLIVTGIVPGHRSAGDVRLVNLSAMLAENGPVALVAVHRGVDGPDAAQTARLASLGVDTLEVSGSRALHVALLTRAFDLVIIEFWHVAEWALPLVRRRQPWAFVAVDTVDLHFVREQRGAELGVLPADPSGERRQRELAVYHVADARIFCTEPEQSSYRSLTRLTEPNFVIPTVVHPTDRSDRPRRPVVVFVGNFWHPPNADAVAWLSQAIWPLVRAGCPTATLWIVGAHPGPDIMGLDGQNGIEVRGFIDDLDGLYDLAAVAVVPLRYGAGMKGKLCEALAAGVPVVSTVIGIEGIDVIAEVDLLVADRVDDFAANVLRLLEDPELALRVGAHGRTSIVHQCGPGPARAGLGLLSDAARRVAVRAPRSWPLRAALARAGERLRPLAADALGIVRRVAPRSSRAQRSQGAR